MQCYICLEEMKNPWDEKGIFSNVTHACCGRPVHIECEFEARKHSLKCPWCRADLPTNKDELKLLLRAGVRTNKGWASMMLADVCSEEHKVGSHRLSIALLGRAIKKLSEGDEWSCKLASCAKISLALELVDPPRSPGAEIPLDNIIQCLSLLGEAGDEGHPGAEVCSETLLKRLGLRKSS